MRTQSTLLLLVLGLLGAAGCDSNGADGDGAGEEERITRVTLVLVGPMHTVIADAVDPEGTGDQFTVEDLDLHAGEFYQGTLSICDDINHRNVSGEVLEEAEFHQVFYTFTGGAAGRGILTVTDRDANGLPVGLTFTLRVTAGGSITGALDIVLSHFIDDTKDGVTRSSQTDLAVTFPVIIHG